MLPDIHRATQKFYIFLIVYLTGCTPSIQTAAAKVTNIGYFIYCERLFACGKSELLFYFHFTEAQCQILLLYVIMTQL